MYKERDFQSHFDYLATIYGDDVEYIGYTLQPQTKEEWWDAYNMMITFDLIDND